MTRPLVPVVLVAATLTAVPAFAQRRGDRGHQSRGAVVVRPYRGGYVAPRPVYAPRYYYPRPYYSFRPRFSIGFGISVGYPVSYPVYAPYYYGYPAPYGYPPPYAQTYPSQPYPAYPSQGYPSQPYPPQGYPSQGYPSQPYPSQQGYPSQGPSESYPSGAYPSQAYPTAPSSRTYPQRSDPAQPSYPSYDNRTVQPQSRDTSNAGGVSFEISPSDAEVFVDGTYRGTVDEFGPQSEPLRLTPGRHRVELRANGLQPMTFDATVAAGQVIPYRGTLQQR